MTNTQIIQSLKLNPTLNIYALSIELGISTWEISVAQHEYLKTALAKYRGSVKWDYPAVCGGMRPWLTRLQFEIALDRIKAGETGVCEEIAFRFRTNTEWRAQLKNQKPD